MAPEQLRGDSPSTGWDLWALAVIAHEMLTGAHPFGGPPHSTAMPASLEQFFQRAFANEAAQRPASAREFKNELEEAINGAGV